MLSGRRRDRRGRYVTNWVASAARSPSIVAAAGALAAAKFNNYRSRSSGYRVPGPRHYNHPVYRFRHAGVGAVKRTNRGNKTGLTQKQRFQSKRSHKSKSLKQRVVSLEKDRVLQSVKSVRRIRYKSLVGIENQCVYHEFSDLTAEKMDPDLATLKVMNRETTPGLDDLSGTAAGRANDFIFKNMYMKVLFRNNGTLPCNIRVYWYKSKEQTSLSIADLLDNGDQYSGINNGSTNIMYFPSQSKYVGQKFILLKTDKAFLQAGDELISRMTRGDVTYDPSEKDVLGGDRQPGDIVCCVRLSGAICHDSVEFGTELGRGNSVLDIETLVKYDIHYQGDISIKVDELDNGASAFTNAPVVQGATIETITGT